MCSLSRQRKVFHVFSWIFHDFPYWPLATSSVGASGKARRDGLRTAPKHEARLMSAR